MILPILFNPSLWSHVGHGHAKALMAPISFETLDRVPAMQPTDPPAEEEDAMAVKKTAA